MASSSALKRKLSGSTDGKPIKIAAVATPGTDIHTAVAGTTAGTYDEIWLWAFNSAVVNVKLTIEFGGAEAPDNNIIVTLPALAGLIPVVPGLILQNSMTVKAFASSSNVITIVGFVNAITD
jgi:hypothetical protein